MPRRSARFVLSHQTLLFSMGQGRLRIAAAKKEAECESFLRTKMMQLAADLTYRID